MLKLVSYNIRYSLGQDGRYDLARIADYRSRGPRKAERLAAIEAALTENDPYAEVLYVDEADVDLNPRNRVELGALRGANHGPNSGTESEELHRWSNDKHFVEKLRDVIGLYLNPPEHALVFCVDEKSQIQALDRSQPGLPMKKGRAGTMTHDYKRHGTTTLFAALNVLEGTVFGKCYSPSLPTSLRQCAVRGALT